MNENDTIVTNKFVLNRVPSLFEEGANATEDVWKLVILGGILLVALVYMALMYYRDSRTIGGLWASLLGFLRFCVYGILVFFYLQPMIKKEEQTISRSKAVLLFDTSLSMIETRDPPENAPDAKLNPNELLSRQDKVLNLLSDAQINFVQRLTDRNDLTLYRFGSNLDPNYFHFSKGRVYTRVEREDPVVNFTSRRGIAAPLPHAFTTALLKPSEHLDTEKMVWFMLTDESLTALAADVEAKDKDASKPLVAKLHHKDVKDKEFLGRAKFISKLTEVLGNQDVERYQDLILAHADRDSFELTDESLAVVDASARAAKDNDEQKKQLTKLREKLDNLKDKEFVGRAQFTKELAKVLDKQEMERHQELVLSLANRGSALSGWDKAKRSHFNDLARENTNTYSKNLAFDGTNIFQSLMKTLEDEQKTRTRAIVLFSDGRSNLGDLRDFDKNLDSGTPEEWQKKRLEKIELVRAKAKELNIPIIVVGIGPKPKPKASPTETKDTKELVRIYEVEGLRHPKQIQPEDNFRVVADVRGDGQPDAEFDARLEITKVRIEPKEVMEDGKKVMKLIETELDMALVEQRQPPKRDPSVKEPPKDEKKTPLAAIPLGKKLILPAVPKPRLDTGFKPRAAVEFEIDPGVLAKLGALGLAVDLSKIEKTEDVADALKKALERTAPQAMRQILDPKQDEADRVAAQIPRELRLTVNALSEEQLKDLVVDAQPDDVYEAAAKATAAARLKTDIVSAVARDLKWGLGVSRPDKGTVKEEYRFKVIVNKHPLDTWPNKDHLEKKGGLRVQKKPLSVMLFTSSASKDYQFLREVIIRETQKDLARLTIVLQTTNRNEVREPGVVQGVPENRFLSEFPSVYDPDVEITSPDSKEAIDNLASYDVIVAIDPDWTRLKEGIFNKKTNKLESVGDHIKEWVSKGGGLIVLGGPLYTKRLARPGDHAKKLQPIIDILPVVLKDIDTVNTERKPDSPWPLDFDQATSELEFLRLSENPGNFLSDWDKIYGTSKDTKSGKYNGFYSFYPVLKTTATSQVIARFGDPEAKTDNNERMPYFVISAPSSPERVIWIGSSETWRLRQAKEVYHERFWTKLLRYAGANTQVRVNKSVKLEPLGGPYTKNDLIRVEARVVDSNGKAVAKDKLTLKLRTRGQGVEEAVPLKLLEQVMDPNDKKIGFYFVAPFSLPKQGTYDVEVTNETGESDKGSLEIREYNAEKEDTRPDFDTLYNLASKAEVVKNRDGMRENSYEKYNKLTTALQASRPKMEGDDGKAIEPDDRRLFFDLTNADLIPDCIDKNDKKEKRPETPEDLRELAFGEKFKLTDESFKKLAVPIVPKEVLEKLKDADLKDKTFNTVDDFEKELDKALAGVSKEDRTTYIKRIEEEAANGKQFKITDESFKRLESAVPKRVLNNLLDMELKDKTFDSKRDFDKEIDKALVGIPDKEKEKYKQLIVQEAAGYWVAKSGNTILSMVLLAVVGLLSLEWLIRKLLRLA